MIQGIRGVFIGFRTYEIDYNIWLHKKSV
jgi:hypothetical protein